jgi:two-component system alkaline phosphatase synthesis response regulator PhoP
MYKILIAEDDAALRKGLEVNLVCGGYQVVSTGRGDAVLPLALKESPDLLLLDVLLPGLRGIEVCRQIREKGLDFPIIFLTACGEEIDRVVGLEVGGDDYVTKPFSERELLARIQARLRRNGGTRGKLTRYHLGDLEIDFTAMMATRDGKSLELTVKEFDILRFLVQHAGKVVTREELLANVWGYEDYPLTRTVDTHILKLRQKLEKDPGNPKILVSVYGAGYRFQA